MSDFRLLISAARFLPAAIAAQIETLAAGLMAVLSDDLLGIYLHGQRGGVHLTTRKF